MRVKKINQIIKYIRNIYNEDCIDLHKPYFTDKEKIYLNKCVDSTYVSSVGQFVNKFEIMMSEIINSKKSVATVNGTSALQICLKVANVKPGDEVITQALTFVATCNAIVYNGAEPVFIDVDLDTMGLSPKKLEDFLDEFGEIRNGFCHNKKTNKRISACLPMHTFGFPVRLHEILKICDKWNIPVIEDAAESLGSYYNERPVGSFGLLSAFSFNGNKIVTSGGGGSIVTNNSNLASYAKFLTTTAKKRNTYEFIHTEIGYNYRMPNINAALACAQLENLEFMLDKKRELASYYFDFFNSIGINFRRENPGTKANYWLMCIELENLKDRNIFIESTNKDKIMTRPIWKLMFELPMYKKCYRDSQKNAIFLAERIVNIPSSVI